MNPRRALAILLVLAGMAALRITVMPLLVRAQGLAIGGYQLVTERSVTRTVSEYTYTAVLTNPGPALAGATAHVTSRSQREVVDADLTFGAIPASGSARSQDTFTFRRNPAVGFNPADLLWTITPVTA